MSNLLSNSSPTSDESELVNERRSFRFTRPSGVFLRVGMLVC